MWLYLILLLPAVMATMNIGTARMSDCYQIERRRQRQRDDDDDDYDDDDDDDDGELVSARSPSP